MAFYELNDKMNDERRKSKELNYIQWLNNQDKWTFQIEIKWSETEEKIC